MPMAMTTNCSGVWRIGEEDIARTESKTGAGSMKGEIESPAGKTATKTTTKGGPFDATIAAAAVEEEEARELWSDKEAVNALFIAATQPGGLSK